MIRKANSSGILDFASTKYLINHFLIGDSLEEPDNWKNILNNVTKDLGVEEFNGGQTFQKIMAQVTVNLRKQFDFQLLSEV